MSCTPTTTDLVEEFKPIVQSFAQIALIRDGREPLEELTTGILYEFVTSLILGEELVPELEAVTLNAAGENLPACILGLAQESNDKIIEIL